MVYFFSSLFSYISSIVDARVQQHRAASAAQQVQAPAQAFAAAWNSAQLRLPAQFIYEQQDPATGVPVTCAPWCDASVSDDGRLLVALTVPPAAPIDSSVLAAHTEDVRMLARSFFQVGMRVVGSDAYQQTLQLALAPVRPQVDARGVVLLGYDDTGAPVCASLIGEVTAISGADSLCLPWVASSYAAIDRQALDWKTALASTRAAIRQAHTGVTQPVMLIDVGDAPCEEFGRPERIKNLADSRRGLLLSSRGDVDADHWAIRPTQYLRRDGFVYTLERDGRSLKFRPAWLY